jgi:hypothetical protein
MAKLYRAKQDVSIPRVVSRVSGEGDDAEFETEGVNYPAGSLVNSEHMTPRDRRRADEGELGHLLDPIPDDEAESYGYVGHDPGEPEFGIFMPEHEAEAHALRQYGHVVVPKDQIIEAQSVSAEHHAAYQQAVKTAGLDKRPMQEIMQQEPPRVPDEVLFGAEHRTGHPHDRGLGIQAEADAGDDNSGDEGEPAVRPRPGTPSDDGE